MAADIFANLGRSYSSSSADNSPHSAENSPHFRKNMLAAGAQKVLQARRAIKNFQKTVEEKKLELSERMSATDRNFSLGERTASATQELSESAAAVDQQLRISEKVAAARLSLSQAAVAADERFRLTERMQALSEELAGDVADLSQMASAQKQKIVNNLSSAAMKRAHSLGLTRELGPALDPAALSFFDAKFMPGVAGKVALTIDDAPCHQPESEKCMLNEVRELLAEFNAKATLFLCTDHVPAHESDLLNMLRDGHEVANHCPADRSYGAESEEVFEAAFLSSEHVCEDLRHRASLLCSLKDDIVDAARPRSGSGSSAPMSPSLGPEAASERAEALGLVLPERPASWFRAPHADASEGMHRVLRRYGSTNVLGDCFANDTVVTDPSVIAQALLSIVDSTGGSIIVVHIPERGFREYNLEALRQLLTGLRERGLRAMTLSSLLEAAWEGGVVLPL